MTFILKHSARIEIIITISTTIRTKRNKNVGPCFPTIFRNLLLLWVQSVRYFWENDIIYSDFQPRSGTRKINGGRRFTEIKVQKTCALCFVVNGNFARYPGKTVYENVICNMTPADCFVGSSSVQSSSKSNNLMDRRIKDTCFITHELHSHMLHNTWYKDDTSYSGLHNVRNRSYNYW